MLKRVYHASDLQNILQKPVAWGCHVSFSAMEFQPYSLFSCSSSPQLHTSTVGSDARRGQWKSYASDQQLLGHLA